MESAIFIVPQLKLTNFKNMIHEKYLSTTVKSMMFLFIWLIMKKIIYFKMYSLFTFPDWRPVYLPRDYFVTNLT